MKTSSIEAAEYVVKAVNANMAPFQDDPEGKPYEHELMGPFLIAWLNKKLDLPYDAHVMEEFFKEVIDDDALTDRADIKIKLIRNYINLCTPLEV